MDGGVTQVEVTVLKAHLLARVGRSGDLKGETELARTEDLKAVCLDLNKTRCDLGVDGVLIALCNDARAARYERL